jgi:hypothetical protein
MQFFFYTMGETQMGRYKFSSWTLHMASIMIFSTLWGIALREWNGTGRRTKLLVAASLFVLIASTVIVGYGNYLGVAVVANEIRARTLSVTACFEPAARLADRNVDSSTIRCYTMLPLRSRERSAIWPTWPALAN